MEEINCRVCNKILNEKPCYIVEIGYFTPSEDEDIYQEPINEEFYYLCEQHKNSHYLTLEMKSK